MTRATLLCVIGALMMRVPVTTTHAAVERIANIIIVAGQSNAVGTGANAATLPPELAAPQTDIPYWYNIHEDEGPPGFIDLQALRDRNGASYFPTFFGPELSAARLIQDGQPEQNYVVVKVCTGGTDLANDWNPDDPESLYWVLFSELVSVELALIADEQTPRIAGMLWMQGESDAQNAPDAAAYEDNLRAFITRFRDDHNVPSMPFVMGRIHGGTPNFILPFSDEVRAAQFAVASEDPLTTMVNIDDIPLFVDLLHFGTDATITMGERFAIAYLALALGPIDLEPPVPGLADADNTLTATGLREGSSVAFVYGMNAGRTPVPDCAGVALDVRRAVLVGTAVTDDQGVASMTGFVPAEAAGLTIHLQAVELDTCRTSDVEVFTF